MTGDIDDLLSRLKSALPDAWFSDSPEVLDAALSGPAQALARLFSLQRWAALQMRIRSASGQWLDLIALDFFGARLQRQPGQSDGSLRSTILSRLFQQGITRRGMIDLLTTLTGRAPVVFEPANINDTGAYGYFGGYGVAGGWGSLDMPLTAFVTVYRPASNVTANLGGYGTQVLGYGVAGRYIGTDELVASTTDADLYAAIARAKPVGSTIWVAIQNQ